MCRTTQCWKDKVRHTNPNVPHVMLGLTVVTMQVAPEMSGIEGLIGRALQEGGLLVVTVVLLFWLREKYRQDKEEKDVLIRLVGQCNTNIERSNITNEQMVDAMKTQVETVNRLAIANERMSVIVHAIDERRGQGRYPTNQG